MTNTMPVLTDSDRQLQIDILTRWSENPNITMHVRDQVALASFTAKPVYQFIVNNPDHDGYIEWADCNPDFYSKEPSDRRRILYTAPPLPAAKPIDLSNCTLTLNGRNDMCMVESEVIAAIRAAGCEVKS